MSVLTPPVVRQLEKLKEAYAAASWETLANGTALVVVPGVALPKGWSKPSVTVRFVLPIGYPSARPDCFWVDPHLTLDGGRTPQSTGTNQIPCAAGNFLWFSWHVKAWDPNKHSVLTWLKVIRERFELLQ